MAKADIELRDAERGTPLVRAAEAGHAEVVRALRNSKADLEAHGVDGCAYPPAAQPSQYRSHRPASLVRVVRSLGCCSAPRERVF